MSSDSRGGSPRLRIEHPEAAPAPAVLTVGRPDGKAGLDASVLFELCYGGVAVASGRLMAGEAEVTLAVPGLTDWMDDWALSVRAWSTDGTPIPVDARCRRGKHRSTGAERKARSAWPGLKGRGPGPDGRSGLVEHVQSARVVQPAANRPAALRRRPATQPVVVYQSVQKLLSRRRALLTLNRRDEVRRSKPGRSTAL